ncbi:RNA polymerase sigma-70 factor, ECF subfamily [Filimonas lacunae]|uniref:RNA polymerase sigma-70 factor, ECF subfamily n=1 Tax=Filimonas lacunae TaxID=477680 RepID=A0A173MDX6_9BACT|nr:sigma-70 family RNA polymerase sigma factor [Filimonas lacunae]BAV05641.1 RNA polymerase ECF-type sigma factor [Filimonas lacunae]SIT29087.1 RNA polymerase sigma-70 factor, ECF subfamily [Filimonas lacunae]
MYSPEGFPDEQSLLLRLKKSDKAAFDLLFHQFADPVITYIRFRLQDEHDAEDVLQEVFIKLWDKRSSIDVHTSFKNYLYTIVQNSIIDHQRKLKRKKYHPAETPPDTQEDTCQPNDHYQYKQLNQLWQQAIKRLPVQMGRIYVMRNEEALSVKEIASELDLSEQTVKNQLHTAGQRIVKIMQQVNTFFL